MVAHDRDLRVALVGYGRGGSVFHAPFIDATPGLRVTGVVTAHPDRQTRAGERHPGAEIFADAEDLWRRAVEFDVAVIVTPDATHVALAHRALDAGLAVVVDKPLALSAVDARALTTRAGDLDQVLTVYQNRRWDADYLTLWDVVDSGALGRVHRFESRFEGWQPTATGTWRDSAPAAEGGGSLNGMAPHLIDQAINLFGPVARVYAELDAIRPGVQAEDAVTLALTHTCGVRSTLATSWVTAQPGPRFRVLGTEGAYTVPTLDASPSWDPQPDPPPGHLGITGHTQTVAPLAGTYESFWSGLRDAVTLGEALPVDPHEVIHALEVITAARHSAATHQVVEV